MSYLVHDLCLSTQLDLHHHGGLDENLIRLVFYQCVVRGLDVVLHVVTGDLSQFDRSCRFSHSVHGNCLPENHLLVRAARGDIFLQHVDQSVILAS